jgi:hypothetical protein
MKIIELKMNSIYNQTKKTENDKPETIFNKNEKFSCEYTNNINQPDDSLRETKKPQKIKIIKPKLVIII